MGGWGAVRTRGAGTTGEIEVAHEALDEVDVPRTGGLAERVLVLVARYAGVQLAAPTIVHRLRCNCDATMWREQFDRACDERDALIAQLKRIGVRPVWTSPPAAAPAAPPSPPTPLPPCGQLAL